MAAITKRLATWVQLKPYYVHAHGCTQAFNSAACGCNVFKFPWSSVDEKHLMRFQSETFAFKFFSVVWTGT